VKQRRDPNSFLDRPARRDRRFVAVHRGGSLDVARHRLLASWAADCAEHVFPLFSRRYPEDDRPRFAIEAARAWSRGEITVGAARAASSGAHAAARGASEGEARAAARACGHAVATAHMADHSLGAAAYAVRAAKSASPTCDAQTTVDRERRWQREHLPEAVRELVLSAQEPGSALSKVTLLWRALAVVLLATFSLAAGCSSGGRQLDGTHWRLAEWTLSSLDPADFVLTATFADGRVSGSSGVNSYSGSCKTDSGGGFEIGDVAGTSMGGPEPAMRAESAFLTLLRQARSFTVAGGKLTLYDEGGNESLIFEPAAKQR